MSKRERKKSENRLRLIRSAAKAFAAQGIKGANINLISLNAGLGKGTVYNYFPSKRELFVAVLNWAASQLNGQLGKTESGDQNSIARLKSIIVVILTFYQERPDLAKLLIRTVAAHQVEHQRAVLAAFEPTLARLQAALAAGIEQGDLRADLDPFISAVTLWGMINHQAAFHWLVSSRPLDPEGVAELVTTYFVTGVRNL